MTSRLTFIFVLIAICSKLAIPQCGKYTLCRTDLQWAYPIQNIYYKTNSSVSSDWATAIQAAADVWNSQSSGLYGISFITPNNNTSNYIDVSSNMGTVSCGNYSSELAETETVPQTKNNTLISYAYTLFNNDPSVN